MANTTKKPEARPIPLPEGRLINQNLFEKSAYTAPNGETGKAAFSVEIAFDPADVMGEAPEGQPLSLEDELANAAAAEWGEAAFNDFLDGKIISPLIDGNKLAARREEKGKAGDAYKGKIVIRPKTTFDGQGPGVDTYDEEAHLIGFAERSKIYGGCFGKVAITIGTYTDSRGEKAMNLYLKAFQKTRDGDKLMASADTSSLFKPVGRQGDGAAPATRRSRKG